MIIAASVFLSFLPLSRGLRKYLRVFYCRINLEGGLDWLAISHTYPFPFQSICSCPCRPFISERIAREGSLHRSLRLHNPQLRQLGRPFICNTEAHLTNSMEKPSHLQGKGLN